MSGDLGSVDIYPVGLFSDIKRRRLGPGRSYLVGRIRVHNWRAVRNYFNGYLAEHPTRGTRCGHGWTRRRALNNLDRHLRTLDGAS